MSELKAVLVFDQRYEAEIARGLLDEAGIESIINADDCGGMFMGVSLLRKGGIKLMVSDEDLERAVDVLAVLKDKQEE